MVTLGANVRTAYDPTAGALKLVAYVPVRVVLALTRVTQRVPDLRWTQTGRDTAPGTLPVALTISPLIAVEGDNERVALTTVACAEETAPKGDTIANTAINTTSSRQRHDPPARTPNPLMSLPRSLKCLPGPLSAGTDKHLSRSPYPLPCFRGVSPNG